MNIFRAYGLPLLVTLPVAIVLGLLGAFLIPLVRGDWLRMLLFLLMCFSSVVIAAFVQNLVSDYTLEEEETDGKVSDSSEEKPK